MGSKSIIAGIALGVALASGFYVASSLNKPAELQAAFKLPMPADLPEFSLLDQAGNTVDAATFRGQWDLVFFGFTHCPDICPTTLQLLASAKQALADSGAARLPRIVLVSVDPERDTPELMAQYIAYFGSDHLAVTGELAEVRRLTAGLGIYFEKNSTDGEDYGVDHSAAVIVIDREGKFSALFSGPHLVENYLHDLPILMDEG